MKRLTCDRAEASIVWREADFCDGPEKSGFCIPNGQSSYPDPSWEPISFCPFCGTSVPDPRQA